MPQFRLIIYATIIFLAFTSTLVQADAMADGDSTNPDISAGSGDEEPGTGMPGRRIEEADFDDEFEDIPDTSVNDPLKGYNRFMTTVNDKLYFWFLKPISKGYNFIVPEPGRLAIARVFKNLMFPSRLVNNLLQLKIKRAGVESARFIINTSVGVAGLWDPAGNWLELQAYDEDFGQTLGHYGVGSGFYLVLPVLGPGNLRDTIGKVPDYFLYPVYYIDNNCLAAGVSGFSKINDTSLSGKEYEDIKRVALDDYTFIRDAYEQNREMLIRE
ncbi:MAG: VacJ family lipoprotein [Desulfobacterales bacterium]|nr:VacJ family lipoprotein [Desulfobacterales bacterium]